MVHPICNMQLEHSKPGFKDFQEEKENAIIHYQIYPQRETSIRMCMTERTLHTRTQEYTFPTTTTGRVL